MSIFTLGLRLTWVHKGVVAVLALLMLSVTLLGTALPRIFESSYQEALKQVVTQADPAETELVVTNRISLQDAKLKNVGDIASWRDRLNGRMPQTLRGLVGEPTYGVRSVGQQVDDRVGEDNVANNFVDLAWDSGIEGRIRYIEGAAPGVPRIVPNPLEKGRAPIVRYDVALPSNVVEEMNAKVGTTFLLSGRALARVTGLYEPVNIEDPYWAAYPAMARARVPNPFANIITVMVTGVVHKDAAAELARLSGPVEYRWGYPIRPAAATITAAPEITRSFDAFSASVRKLSTRYAETRVVSGLPALMDGFLARLSSTQSLMLLQLTAVGAAAFGVVLLVIGLLTTRLADSLIAARARAASSGQVVALGGVVLALALLPAMAVGYGLSRLVPGIDTPVSRFAPLLLAVAGLGYGLARMATAHRGPLREGRDDVAGQAFSPRRLVMDILVVGLAGVAAYLANSRGVAGGSLGGDPLLVAAPTAVALAVALVILRTYPFLLRALSRATARGRTSVTFLALATAARSRAVGTLPALVLVPALTMSVYGTLTLNALDAGQNVAAWQQTGANALVQSPAALSRQTIEQVSKVPGVQGVIPADLGAGRLAGGSTTFHILALDLDAYERLLSPVAGAMSGHVSAMRSAVSGSTTGRALPIVATKGFGVAKDRLVLWDGKTESPIPVTRVGTLDRFPGVVVQDELVVIPAAAAAKAGLTLAPNQLYVFGAGVDRAALAKAAGPTTKVTTREAAIAAITGAPLTSTIRLAFQIVALALAAYSLLAVWITVVAGAAERPRNIALLRTLGMTSRQAQAVTVGEIAPLIVLAGLAGLFLGVAFPALFGGAVDLSGHAGGLPVGYTISWTVPLLLAAGITLAALAGAIIQVAVAVRRSVGLVLRAGE